MSSITIPLGLDVAVELALDQSEAGARVVPAESPPADEHSLWRTVEVRHLAALVAVAEEGSFRRAADRLGYVQSAISNQIARLERAAGVRLVERASGSSLVQLTAAGRVLLGHTREIITRLDAAYTDVSSLASQAAGTIHVAGLERFSPRRLARVLRCFRERYPLSSVVLESGGDDALNLSRLSGGSIDLFVGEPPTDGPFSYLTLEHDTYVLLVAAGSPLGVRREPPSAGEIASLRLMIPSSCGLTSADEARLRELGIEPRSPLRPESVATARALVEAGLGEALVLRSGLDPRRAGCVAIDLPGLLPERTIALVYHSERDYPTAAHGFIRAVNVACEAERRSADSVAA